MCVSEAKCDESILQTCRFLFYNYMVRIFAAYIFGDLLYSLMVKNLRIENLPLYNLEKDVFLGVGKYLK